MKDIMSKLKKEKPSRPSDTEADMDMEELLGGEGIEDMDLADELGAEPNMAAGSDMAALDESELIAELEKRGYTVAKGGEGEETPAYESEEEDLMNA